MNSKEITELRAVFILGPVKVSGDKEIVDVLSKFACISYFSTAMIKCYD